jgi:protein-disulfide isomerase
MNKKLDWTITTLLVGMAVGLAWLAAGNLAKNHNAEILVGGLSHGGQRLGSQSGAIEVIEFADFQCPHCAAAADALYHFVFSYPEEITVIFRHLPLTEIHPKAFAAALGGVCADAQGRFPQYHNLLFGNRSLVASGDVWEWGQQAGVPDPIQFKECVQGDSAAAVVRKDLKLAQGLGVTATPTFFINGEMTVGVDSMVSVLSTLLGDTLRARGLRNEELTP